MSSKIGLSCLLCMYFAVAGFSAENLLGAATISKESGWLSWMSEQMIKDGAKIEFKDAKAVAVVPNQIKPKCYEMQLVRPLELEADKTYRLQVRAASDKVGKIVISYGLRYGTRTTYGSVKIPVEAGEKMYEAVLQVKKDGEGKYETPRVLRIHLGEVPEATITISEISLEAQ